MADIIEIKYYEDYIQQLLKKNIKEIDEELSPSKWVKRMPSNDVIDYHIRYITKISENIKDQNLTTYSYGLSEREKFDIVRSNLKEKQNDFFFIFLHGGYWQGICKENYHWIADTIITLNGVAVFIEYDLAPYVTVNDIVEQVSKALKEIIIIARTQQIRKVYIGGHSAGAHIAIISSILLEESKDLISLIKGFWLVSGVYDLRPLVYSTENVALNLTHSSSWTLSPLNNINLSKFIKLFSKCKTVIWFAEYDPPIFQKQAIQLKKMLDLPACDSILYEAKEKDHFSIMEDCTDPNQDLLKEFSMLIKG